MDITNQSFDWAAKYYDITRGIPKLLLYEILSILKKDISIHLKDRILEVGIGTGRMSNFFAKKLNKTIIGIDISREMLRICLEKREPACNVQLILADGTYLPFKQKFDVIMTSHLLHLVKSKFVFLDNILNYLSSEGYYVNIDAYVNYHNTFPFKMYYHYLGGERDYYIPKGELTRKSITIYLKNRGWIYLKEEFKSMVSVELNTILRFIKNQVFSHLRLIEYNLHRKAVEQLFLELECTNHDLFDKIPVPVTGLISIFRKKATT